MEEGHVPVPTDKELEKEHKPTYIAVRKDTPITNELAEKIIPHLWGSVYGHVIGYLKAGANHAEALVMGLKEGKKENAS